MASNNDNNKDAEGDTGMNDRSLAPQEQMTPQQRLENRRLAAKRRGRKGGKVVWEGMDIVQPGDLQIVEVKANDSLRDTQDPENGTRMTDGPLVPQRKHTLEQIQKSRQLAAKRKGKGKKVWEGIDFVQPGDLQVVGVKADGVTEASLHNTRDPESGTKKARSLEETWEGMDIVQPKDLQVVVGRGDGVYQFSLRNETDPNTGTPLANPYVGKMEDGGTAMLGSEDAVRRMHAELMNQARLDNPGVEMGILTYSKAVPLRRPGSQQVRDPAEHESMGGRGEGRARRGRGSARGGFGGGGGGGLKNRRHNPYSKE